MSTLRRRTFLTGVTLLAVAVLCQTAIYVSNALSDGHLPDRVFGMFLCLGLLAALGAILLTTFGVGWQRLALPLIAMSLFMVMFLQI